MNTQVFLTVSTSTRKWPAPTVAVIGGGLNVMAIDHAEPRRAGCSGGSHDEDANRAQRISYSPTRPDQPLSGGGLWSHGDRHEAIDAELLPARRLGKKIVVRRPDVDEFLKKLPSGFSKERG
jgi:hypothetical protein